MYFSGSRKRRLIDSSSSTFSSATSQHSSLLHTVELGLKVAWGSVLPAVDHSTCNLLDAVALHTSQYKPFWCSWGKLLLLKSGPHSHSKEWPYRLAWLRVEKIVPNVFCGMFCDDYRVN
jgi:hypothetical protein